MLPPTVIPPTPTRSLRPAKSHSSLYEPTVSDAPSYRRIALVDRPQLPGFPYRNSFALLESGSKSSELLSRTSNTSYTSVGATSDTGHSVSSSDDVDLDLSIDFQDDAPPPQPLRHSKSAVELQPRSVTADYLETIGPVATTRSGWSYATTRPVSPAELSTASSQRTKRKPSSLLLGISGRSSSASSPTLPLSRPTSPRDGNWSPRSMESGPDTPRVAQSRCLTPVDENYVPVSLAEDEYVQHAEMERKQSGEHSPGLAMRWIYGTLGHLGMVQDRSLPLTRDISGSSSYPTPSLTASTAATPALTTHSRSPSLGMSLRGPSPERMRRGPNTGKGRLSGLGIGMPPSAITEEPRRSSVPVLSFSVPSEDDEARSRTDADHSPTWTRRRTQSAFAYMPGPSVNPFDVTPPPRARRVSAVTQSGRLSPDIDQYSTPPQSPSFPHSNLIPPVPPVPAIHLRNQRPPHHSITVSTTASDTPRQSGRPRTRSLILLRRRNSVHIDKKPDRSPVLRGLDAVPASQILFYAGFLLGPWCFLLGGWYLHRSGELPNHVSPHGMCRCPLPEPGEEAEELEMIDRCWSCRRDIEQWPRDKEKLEHYVLVNRIAGVTLGAASLVAMGFAISRVAGPW